MRSRTDEVQIVTLDLVDQQAVRLDVTVAVVLPVADGLCSVVATDSLRLTAGSPRATSRCPCRASVRVSRLAETAPRVPGFAQNQIPKSLNSAPAEFRRFPVPRSAARIAFKVVALGTFTANGRAFSAATRTNSIRTASDTEIPIPARLFAALCFVF